jgi:Uma2 family endonuclease
MSGTTGRETRDATHWTREAVLALPDDSNRYELIGGELVVTPAPSGRHQVALMTLYDRLRPLVTAAGLGGVLVSPADIALGEDEVLQPDLFVYRTATGRPLGTWSDISELLLVAEILSPSSARYDRDMKRRRYQRAGVPEYWIVDLDGRVVERWHPEESRPEVLSGRLRWSPADGIELDLDLATFFGEVWGE